MTIELSEYVIDAIADAIVKKMQVPTEEEKALLQKWHDNRGISMKDFEDAMDALEQEPCRETDDYENEIEDLHNRLDIAEYDKERLREEVTNLEEKIKALEQEPKAGHWIYSKAVNTGEIIFSECSVCGNGESRCAKRMNYCPNCGAKMAESEGNNG